MSKAYGPTQLASDKIHADKYRAKGESFREAMSRVASVLSDSEEHFHEFREILLDMRFLPGGRIQKSIGSSEFVTPYNCYVSGTIEDSFTEGSGSIMQRASQAAATMRMGGGIGYDFSTLRPRGALIRKLRAQSSGPVAFMGIFNEVCLVTNSSGARRGAQMGVLRVDHPDIEEFIRAKQNIDKLTGFNISVAITDQFMRAVGSDSEFPLRFGGVTYRTVRALDIWNMIMRSTYDWAEPGVLFIDQINRMNNLHYCEQIDATNPCGEQPLPPFGACLLGSINLVRYLDRESPKSGWIFDYEQLFYDLPIIVRAMDNVVDRARYPLYEQEQEALSKRRMGLGVTGVANTIEAMGYPYGSRRFLIELRSILTALRDTTYRSSALLAKEKGPFPKFNRDEYMRGEFIQTLSEEVKELIYEHGIRNSHLLSIAPTGTISLAADNISSGIEPVYLYEVARTVLEEGGPITYNLEDYGSRVLGVRGITADQCTVEDHLNVLIEASRFVDSAVSKTCNVPSDISWEDFQQIYMKAWKSGCKGCTTYRKGGLREGIMKPVDYHKPELLEYTEGLRERALEVTGVRTLADLSCDVDPISGRRNCE